MYMRRIAAVGSWLLAGVLLLTTVQAQEKGEVVIEKGKTVAIHYTLKLDDGTLVSSNQGREPLSYQQGEEQILPALEEALLGLKAGESKQVALSPDQGYGVVNPDAFVAVPLDRVPDEAREVGTMLLGRDAQGNERQVRVHEIRDAEIVIDHNHPLAGKNLNFEVTIITIE